MPMKARSPGALASAAGVAHRDMVRQSKKFLLFRPTFFTNTTGQFAFGYDNVNIATSSAGVANTIWSTIMDTAALTYEEYRIRRVIVRGQLGQGMGVDDRVKTSIFARVDVNSQPSGATSANLNSLIQSESTVNRTFIEHSNVKLCDFAPICFTNGAISRPVLPTNDQWYNIDERDQHLWRGATISPILPESGISPDSKAITIWVDVEVEFRGRSNSPATFQSLALSSELKV